MDRVDTWLWVLGLLVLVASVAEVLVAGRAAVLAYGPEVGCGAILASCLLTVWSGRSAPTTRTDDQHIAEPGAAADPRRPSGSGR